MGSSSFSSFSPASGAAARGVDQHPSEMGQQKMHLQVFPFEGQFPSEQHFAPLRLNFLLIDAGGFSFLILLGQFVNFNLFVNVFR
jgi:hypothetical protein